MNSVIYKFKKHWFVAMLVYSAAIIGATWRVADEILVKPRDYRISELQSEIDNKKLQIQAEENKKLKEPHSTSPQNQKVSSSPGAIQAGRDVIISENMISKEKLTANIDGLISLRKQGSDIFALSGIKTDEDLPEIKKLIIDWENRILSRVVLVIQQ